MPEDMKQGEAVQQAAPAAQATPFTSAGWRIHNELTYRGINWLLNSTLGVGFAYLVKVTERGKQYFSQPVTRGFEKILSPIIKNKNHLKFGAGLGATFVSIMFGGTAIIPLVMAMENKKNKKKIVRGLDKIIYGKDAVENDPKFEASYCNIDKEPEKKFGVGTGARFIALAPLLAVSIYHPTSNWLNENIYSWIAGKTRGVAEGLGIKPAKMMTELATVDGNVKTKWEHLHDFIAFDFGLTALYAVLHEITYKTLAAMGVKEEKSDNKKGVSSCGVPMQKLSEPVAVQQVEPSAAARLRREKNESYTQAVEEARKGVEAGQLAIS